MRRKCKRALSVLVPVVAAASISTPGSAATYSGSTQPSGIRSERSSSVTPDASREKTDAEPSWEKETRTYQWHPFLEKYVFLDRYPCYDAHDHGIPVWPIDMIDNSDCGRRVWLHEDLNPDTGWDYCIGPGRIKVIPEAYDMPARISIGAYRPCP